MASYGGKGTLRSGAGKGRVAPNLAIEGREGCLSDSIEKPASAESRRQSPDFIRAATRPKARFGLEN